MTAIVQGKNPFGGDILPPVPEYTPVLTEAMATAYVVEGIVRYCLGQVEQGIEKVYGDRIFGSYWLPMSHELVEQGTALIEDNIRPTLPVLVCVAVCGVLYSKL